jgi:hypothetical protein
MAGISLEYLWNISGQLVNLIKSSRTAKHIFGSQAPMRSKAKHGAKRTPAGFLPRFTSFLLP